MAFDQPQVNGTQPADPGSSSRFKVRIRFQKAGDLRFLSHHDLMHCFERMFRRCGLPVKASQGFHPMPRMAFALSLALGIAGNAEVLELELERPMAVDDIRQRLMAQAPQGMEIIDVCSIDPRVRAQVRRAFYRVAIPREQQINLPARIAALLDCPTCWVQRARPQPRKVDIRPYLDDLRLEDDHLHLSIWVTPTGTARPDDLWSLLGLEDVIAAGALVERTKLELHDEVADAPGAAGLPHQNVVMESSDVQAPASKVQVEPALRPTSLFPGPLSFDS